MHIRGDADRVAFAMTSRVPLFPRNSIPAPPYLLQGMKRNTASSFLSPSTLTTQQDTSPQPVWLRNLSFNNQAKHLRVGVRTPESTLLSIRTLAAITAQYQRHDPMIKFTSYSVEDTFVLFIQRFSKLLRLLHDQRLYLVRVFLQVAEPFDQLVSFQITYVYAILRQA